MGVSLTAVAHYGYLFAFERLLIRIFIIVDFNHHSLRILIDGSLSFDTGMAIYEAGIIVISCLLSYHKNGNFCPFADYSESNAAQNCRLQSALALRADDNNIDF